jgi:hypothetical protein
LKGQLQPVSGNARDVTKRQDLLCRFTSLPHITDLRLMQRTVRLETNSRALLALALKFFERHQHGRAGQPEFLWRVVCESDPQVQSTAVQFAAFSDLGLRYVNIGKSGFLAVDLEKRVATGFLARLFLEGEPRFRHCRSLDILFCMTAASLGLTALSGGCVGVKDRGVMVFGPPNSGKTTACYLAAKLGMEFHADQVVFLDTSGNFLRAWGDLLPAVFRPEALDFLPELWRSSRGSSYIDLSFYYFDKAPLQEPRARPVIPVCSIFLDRGTAGEPQLKQITREHAISRMRECMLFHEDQRFDAQITAALTALAGKPVYILRYGDDPKIAATFIEKMLR